MVEHFHSYDLVFTITLQGRKDFYCHLMDIKNSARTLIFAMASLVAEPMQVEDSWPGSGSSGAGETRGAQRERPSSSGFRRAAAK